MNGKRWAALGIAAAIFVSTENINNPAAMPNAAQRFPFIQSSSSLSISLYGIHF